MKKYFVWIWLGLLASFAAASIAGAQGANVEFSISYTAQSGASNPKVQVQGFPDYSELEVTGGGTQSSDVKLVYMGLDDPIVLQVTSTELADFRLSVQAPSQYGMIIKGIRRNVLYSNPFNDGGEQFIQIMMVRNRERGPGNGEPVGEASSISWGMPRAQFDTLSPQGPFMLFNLGSGVSGESLPPLRIPLRYHGTGSEVIVPPDSPEITSPAPPGMEFQLDAPQTTARLILDNGTPGNFSLTFSPPGTNSPWVTYNFAWQNSPRQAKVTKVVTGGLTYETLIKGNFNAVGWCRGRSKTGM